MAASESCTLRIVVVEAYGLGTKTTPVRVSVSLDGQQLGRSPAVSPMPAAHWDFQVETTCLGESGQLLFEVTRPGLFCCSSTPVGGCTLSVAGSSWVDRQTLPLWDFQQQTIGSLVVSIRRESGDENQGLLANRAALPLRASATPAEDERPVLRSGRLSGSSGGLANLAVDPAQQALPGSLQKSGTCGLQNQAVADSETGTRHNALPRARELLDGLVVFSPEDAGQRRTLQQALEELRHAPAQELQSESGEATLEMCSGHIEELFQHALGRKDEEAAGGAIWLAGRLPQLEEHEDDAHVTLQDRLRRRFHEYQMEAALDSAAALVPDAKREMGALERLMEALDLAESHASLARCNTQVRLESILADLRPHVPARLDMLLGAGRFEEVEGVLNVIGAGRSEALDLHRVHSKLDILKGIDLVRTALTPTPGQIGFPVLKQRQLRHATMTVRTALAGDMSAETAAKLERLLFQELLPTCVRHSRESMFAALQTAFGLLNAADRVWAAVHSPYEELSADRKRELAHELPKACQVWRVAIPDWLVSPELAACQQAIRDALAGTDPGALQVALLQVKEADGGRELCAAEFEEALRVLRLQHRLPEGWNVESMLAGQAQQKLLAKQELTDPSVIRAFDRLLKSTTNPVWTRDRKGRVTKGFEAVRVVHVMNAMTWASYVKRRDEILGDREQVTWPYDDAHWQDNLNGALMTKEAFGAIEPLVSAPPLLEKVNEGWFLHGTSHAGAAAISSDDFDMARARPTGLYGAGIYLAESVSKSDEYVQGETADGVELFPILVCRVCLGNIYYCPEKLPDRRNLEDRCLRQEWHSVLGDRKKTSGTFREFIIYDPNQVFPGYIVYYKRTG